MPYSRPHTARRVYVSISQAVPSHLQAPAEAARAWFSRHHNSEFKVTGIVNSDTSTEHSPFDLQLILCGERNGIEVCLKEQFEVVQELDDFVVNHRESDPPDIGSPAPELDPPEGYRQTWLSNVLNQHAFVVLLFYRGLW